MNFKMIKAGILGLSLGIGNIASAGIITFDDPIVPYESIYSADSDGDSVIDAVFTSTSNDKFTYGGPGSNQLYTDGIGLGFSVAIDPLRIDFLHGAVDNLNFSVIFGNLINVYGYDEVIVNLFDSSDTLIASTTQFAELTLLDGVNFSDYPETVVDLSFSGVASYATFKFPGGPSSEIFIDNFSGTFGSSERTSVPEPSTLAILALGLIGLNARRLKK